ncbi:YuzD family protein [Bacillus sp. FJAT-45037]|uniref:YuzD family protein n=1 Tax=Bacillus sp. FJAT-45037 TaxID=2011007 RepID=UPI000C236845|nr:YuzD family protein [Bacillus sp. FJAT-45037]
MKEITLVVYGAEEKCASCINLPTAYETKEWLEAALNRKYPQEAISVEYVDIHGVNPDHHHAYIQAILDDEYFYPLIVLDGEVIAEGNPRLKAIYEKIEAIKS